MGIFHGEISSLRTSNSHKKEYATYATGASFVPHAFNIISTHSHKIPRPTLAHDIVLSVEAYYKDCLNFHATPLHWFNLSSATATASF